MKYKIICLLLLAACTQISYEEHTSAGSKYLLPNNLTIILKENHDTGMIAIDLFVKGSLATEKIPGLAHFTNRMLLAGTQKRTREDITRQIEKVGGTITARTYAEYSEILIEVPSDSFSVALDILSDLVLKSAFTPEEIERERTKILGELAAKKDNPNIVIEELFMKQLYPEHPYQKPIDGYEEPVKQTTRENIIQHYQDNYVPNNIIISIVGNIKEKPTIAALQKLFGEMKPKKVIEQNLAVIPQYLPPKMQNMELESAYIQQGYNLVPATHPDFIKLRMANAILGSGSGSRLFYELRDKKALAYSVYSIAPSTRAPGFIKISMISRPSVLNNSLAGINEQINLLKNETVEEGELKLVKQKIRGFFFLDHQKIIDQANYLGLYEMQGLGYQYDVMYPILLSQVSSEDVQEVANKYFKNPAIAIIGPFEQAKIE